MEAVPLKERRMVSLFQQSKTFVSSAGSTNISNFSCRAIDHHSISKRSRGFWQKPVGQFSFLIDLSTHVQNLHQLKCLEEPLKRHPKVK